MSKRPDTNAGAFLSRIGASLRSALTRSLRRQLVLGVVGVHAVMMTFFVVDLVTRQEDFLLRQQSERAQSRVENLAVAASAGVLSRDYAGLAELVAAQQRDPELQYVMLVNAEGLVLAHSEPQRVSRHLVDAASLAMLEAERFVWLAKGRELTDAAAPVRANGRVIGWARVGLSPQRTLESLDQVVRDGLLYTLAAIVIGAVLAVLIANRLTRRLNRLRETMAAVTAGRPDQRVAIGGSDEAAAMAADFNAMLDALEERKVQLGAARDALAQSEERFELAMRGANDGLWDWDLANNTVYYSPRWKAVLGYEEAELGDRFSEWQSRIHPDDRDSTLADIRAHLEGNTPLFVNIHRLRHRDGHYVWTLGRGVAVRDRAGKPYRMVGTQTDISTRKALENQLAQFKQALDEHAFVSIADAEGRITYANDKLVGISGYRREELLGENHRLFKSGVHPEAFYRELWETITAGRVWRGEVCNRSKDGRLYWMLTTIVPFLDDEGVPRQFIAIRADITALKAAEAALHEEKELAQVTLASIGDGVVTTDAEGRVSFLNPVAERLTGWTSAQAQGRAVTEVMRLVHEETLAPVENPVEHCRREQTVVGMAQHTVLVARDGREIAVEDSAAPIFDREGRPTGVVMVFHDVTEKRALSREMAWQSTHDGLTGLSNRKEFEARLAALLDRARAEGRHHALFYLDLDQFKIVNDTCGHQAGDELLRQIAGLMQSQIRAADVLARLGGDEFGMLLEDCPREKAVEIAEKLRRAVRDFRFAWKERVFEVGVSIGVVELDLASGSLSDVMADADLACYAAKDKGRNRVHVHSASDSEALARRHELEVASGVRAALQEGRIALYAQEIRPLHGGVSHYEVLMRVLDEEGRPQSPAVFIPAAERYGLMGEVDRWVVRRVFELAAASPRPLELAVNLSGLSIGDERFVQFVRDELQSRGLDASRFCFEITETAAIAHLGQAMHFIDEMKALGFRFALDDFGSGMSSFAYLKNLPVDFIKIDGAFVRDIADNPLDRAFVEAINRIGQVMGMETIAEFVENEAVLRELAYLGVDYAQGYGVARPAPFEALLNSGA